MLLAAIQLADTQDGVDLVGTLASPDLDVTVFAPNYAAFKRLARDLGFSGRSEAEAFDYIVDALVGLLGDAALGVLTDVLLFHVARRT